MQELVPAMVFGESGQVRRFLIKVDAPEAIHSIQLAEACSTIELMRNLLEGGSLVLSNSGLVQVLWIEANTKGTIMLGRVSEGRHPLRRSGDRCYHSLVDHVIKGVLCQLLLLCWYLPLGILD